MYGIIGITGRHKVTERLVDGLKRLEYRGYDSSGIALLTGGNWNADRLKVRSAIWKLESQTNR